MPRPAVPVPRARAAPGHRVPNPPPRYLALTGDIRRFPNQEHYATTRAPRPSTSPAATRKPAYPDEATVSSTPQFHVAAVTQARDPGPGRDHYRRKLTEHKTPKEARRSLKRRLSNTIYRRILADHQRTQNSRRLTHRGAPEPHPTTAPGGPQTGGEPHRQTGGQPQREHPAERLNRVWPDTGPNGIV